MGPSPGGNAAVGGSTSSDCAGPWTLADVAELEFVGDTGSVLLGDIDRDDRLDLFTLSSTEVFVFHQAEDGSLSPAIAFSTELEGSTRGDAPAFGDWDGDGFPDLVVATYSHVHWLPNDRNGGFLAAQSLGDQSANGTRYQRVLLDDVDRDGFLDAAVLALNFVDVYYGNGDGSVRDRETVSSSGILDDFALVDVNADGKLDVVGFTGSGDLVTYEQGSRSFAGDPTVLASSVIADIQYSLEAGDLDGDGAGDLVGSGRHEGSEEIVLLHAHDRFVSWQRLPTYNTPREIRIADIDGNGENDVIVIHSGWERLGIYRQCNGVFAPEHPFDVPYIAAARDVLVVGDLNGDGCRDVVLDGNSESGAFVLFGRNCGS
jgi:hypothetical protein